MASNDITKNIHVKVDSAEVKAFAATQAKILDLQRQINRLQAQSEHEYKLKTKQLQNQLDLMRRIYAEGGRWKKFEGESLAIEIAKVEKQQKLLALNRRLAQEKKKAAEEERRAQYRALQDRVSGEASNRAREAKRAEWERGTESPWFKGRRYAQAGAGAFFEARAEQVEEAGRKRVAGIDEEIAQREDQVKLNQGRIEQLRGELSDPNSTLTKSQIKKKRAEIEALTSKNASIGQEIETKKDERSQAIGETKTQVSKYKALGEAAQQAASVLKSIAKVLLLPFKQLADAVKDAVKQMLSFNTGVATYNTATSLVTNSAAREQQLRYGLTAAQNYAFAQAKSMLGIESEEDLMYMNSDQRNKLLSYMDKYARWYDRMESSGVLQNIQDLNIEFNELKQEIAMEFLQWVAANKETILGLIKGIFEFVKGVANVVMGIMDILSWGKYKHTGLASLSDTTNYETNNNQRNTVVNVTANTTNNATGILSSQDALDQYNKENFSKLAKQLATAIGG